MADTIDRVGGAVLKDLIERTGFCEAWDDTDEDLKHELRRTIGTEALRALLEPDSLLVVRALRESSSLIDIDSAKALWRAMIQAALEPPPGCTCRLLHRTNIDPLLDPPEPLLDKHCLIHGWWVPDPDDAPDEDEESSVTNHQKTDCLGSFTPAHAAGTSIVPAANPFCLAGDRDGGRRNPVSAESLPRSNKNNP